MFLNFRKLNFRLKLDLTEFYGLTQAPQLRGNLSILLEAFGNATDAELSFHAGANIFIERVRLFRQTERGKTATDIRSVKRHPERALARLVLSERLRGGW